jgi:hypothetical protein
MVILVPIASAPIVAPLPAVSTLISARLDDEEEDEAEDELDEDELDEDDPEVKLEPPPPPPPHAARAIPTAVARDASIIDRRTNRRIPYPPNEFFLLFYLM